MDEFGISHAHCIDRNGNGVIDNGSELFGENTLMSNGKYASGGIEVLADLDTNRDGIINADDALLAL